MTLSREQMLTTMAKAMAGDVPVSSRHLWDAEAALSAIEGEVPYWFETVEWGQRCNGKLFSYSLIPEPRGIERLYRLKDYE